MLEPLNVAAEMISLAIMANQDLAGRIPPEANLVQKKAMLISITEMRHAPIALSSAGPQATPILLGGPAIIPAANCFVITFIGFTQIFAGDSQATGGFIPPANPVTAQLGFFSSFGASGTFTPITGTVAWQSLLNCSIIEVIPPGVQPVVVINWPGAPLVTNTFHLRVNGYQMPAGRQPVYQRFATVLNS
jgi:hypothetical protein